jgi:hypothetical protein
MPHPSGVMGKKYLKPVDGFDAKGLSRVFAIDGGTHDFVNLLFTGGSDVCDDGGNAMWIRGTNTKFKNCLFTKNYGPTVEVTVEGRTFYALATGGTAPTGKKTNGCGGALALLTGYHVFEDCVFDDNMNRQGAALWVSGGGLTIKNSIFVNNGDSACYHMTTTPAPSRDNHGGAIQLQNNHGDTLRVVIESSLFYSNTAYGQGGAIRQAPNANKTTQEAEGKNPFIDMTIRDCIFSGNYANEAGALMVHNESLKTKNTVRVFNSQFFDNKSNTDAGAIKLWSAQPGDEYTMVNSSVIYNITNGNGGHGAGLLIATNATHKRANRTKQFYNNIFDGNKALNLGDNPHDELGYDFHFREGNETTPEPFVAGEMDMDGNLIGRVGSSLPGSTTMTTETWPAPAINEFPTEMSNDPLLYINYSGYNVGPAYDPNYTPNVDDTWAAFYPDWFYVVPLKDNAYARTFGKAEYLTVYGIEKDVLGFDRVVADGQCTAGAVEAKGSDLFNTDGSGLDFTTWAWPLSTLTPDLVDDGSGISTIQSLKTMLVVRGGALELTNGSNATIEVIGLSGATVKSGAGSVSLENLPKGVYVAKAQVGGNVYIRKFIK